jgi:pyruvate dehydrogenase (quinone)/pyruvate oxidase
MPVDLQGAPVKSGRRSDRNVAGHVSDLMAYSSRMPSEDQLARAADILNAGKKTVILAGRGALGAGEQLLAVADRLAAPIAKPLLGKAAVPDENPFLRRRRRTPRHAAGARRARTMQHVVDRRQHFSFPYIEFYPKPGQARAVQIELDPNASACAIRWKPRWWETARASCGHCFRCSNSARTAHSSKPRNAA